MAFYRIQHPTTGYGMWATLSSEGEPMVTYLSDNPLSSKPMLYSDVYGYRRRRWYSAVESIEQLKYWLSDRCIQELLDMGFEIFEFEAEETYDGLPDEIIFTKESVTVWTNITERFVQQLTHAT